MTVTIKYDGGEGLKQAPAPVGQVVAYFDGVMAPTNPNGYGCGGWWAERDGHQLFEGGGVYYRPGDEATNNMAEYKALIHLLGQLEERDLRGVLIRGDSQLVVRQVMGEYRVQSQHLLPLFHEAQETTLLAGHKLEWIPRELNWRADQLSQAQLSSTTGRIVTRTSNVVSVELYEYACSSCGHLYVMRLVEDTVFCMKCAAPLARRDFSMRNAPSARVMHLLREAGYRTIMYYFPGW